MLWTGMSNPAILKELGKRFEELRLRKNIMQAKVAENSGVSLRTISRFEKGESISTVNLIKLMRELEILENLEQLIPEMPVSPLLMRKLQSKKRKKASNPRNK